MTVTTVNPKGQVTIPEPLRTKYGFPPGTKVVWIEREGYIFPQRLLSLDELQGMFKAKPGEKPATQELLEERRADREREERKARF
jgi:bifunctional DNA-binding transcriptional regulator/antitoxin component of YhaV-PrlF toxin-antitoxin module